MNMKEFGIVLGRPNPQEHVFWVFCPNIGSTQLLCTNSGTRAQLQLGTIIGFVPWLERNRQLKAESLEIIAINPAQNWETLRWISTLLALTRWTTEPGQEYAELFMHLCFCYKIVQAYHQSAYTTATYDTLQTACTVGLLYLLGCNPPTIIEPLVGDVIQHTTAQANFDLANALDQKFMETIGRMLNKPLALHCNAWINHCIKTHPHHQRFTLLTV